MIPRLNWTTLTIPPAGRLNNAASTADQRQMSAAGSRSVVPLTYGQDRIGGLVLNVLPTSSAATTVLVQVLWGFGGHAIESVLINGEALPAGATVTHYLGGQSSPDAALVAAFAAQSISYGDTLQGYAYSVLALPGSFFSSELQITALYSGRRLYDPRKDSTQAGGSGAHRLNNPATWEWSNNPSLAQGDFLASRVYGANKAVDWASVIVAANANDAMVGSPAEKRRIVGVTFIGATSVQDVAETLRAYAGVFLLPTAAGVKLLPDADDAPVADYVHAAGDIAAITPLQLRDLGNSPTVVEIIYTDTTVVPWRDDPAFAELPGVGATRPYRLSQVRLPGIHRYSQARREAIERLNKLTLQDLSTSIEVFDAGIRHQRGDIVRVTHPIGVSNKLFRVVDIEAPGPGRWVLLLVEHDPGCYSSVVETVPVYANSGAVISEAAGGGSGISSYMIEIYTQAATQPATPQGGQYTFEGDVFVPPAGGAFDPLFLQVDLLLDFEGAEGSTLFIDRSANNRSLSIANGTPVITTADARIGTACLTGVNRGLARIVTDIGAAPSNKSWSIECYIKRIGSPSYFAIGSWVSGGRKIALRTPINGGAFQFGMLGTTLSEPDSVFTTETIAENVWTHVFAGFEQTSDTTGTLRLFINGGKKRELAGIAWGSAQAPEGIFDIGRSDTPGFAGFGLVDAYRLTRGAGAHRYTDDFVPETEPHAGPASDTYSWSRDQPEGTATPTWASRYLAQTTTPAVPIVIPVVFIPGNVLDAPLIDNALDTVAPIITPTIAGPGTTVFGPSGVTLARANFGGATITYPNSGKLNAAANNLRFSVSVRIALSGAGGGVGSDAWNLFTFGSGSFQAGFQSWSPTGPLRIYPYLFDAGLITGPGVSNAPFVTALSSHELEIEWTEVNTCRWKIDGIVVYERAFTRTAGPVVISNGVPSLQATFSRLRVHRGAEPATEWSVPNKHVQDGEGGAVLYLTASSQTFTFSGANVATPTLQTITFTAIAASLTGTPSFIGTLFDASGTSLGAATLGGSGATRTLTVANFGAAQRCVVTVTQDGFSDSITVVRLRDGAGNITGYLTNESAIVDAAADGTVASFDGTGGTFEVFNGLTNVTGAGVTYTVVSEIGVDVSIASTGVYTVASMSANTGTATLRAVVGGVTVNKVYSIAKALAGDPGAPGAPGGDAFVLELDNSNVTVPADLSGFVTSYTAARTNIRIIRGGTTDDTANWTLAKTDGAGIVSTLTGATLAVTSLTNDAASVQITATKAGFAELRARFTVTRARSATAVSGPLSGANFGFAVFKLPPSGVGVVFENNGTVKGGDSAVFYPVVGNWYAPTTAAIGESHWIRVTPRAGASTLDSGVLNTWLAIGGNLWAYEVAALGAPKEGVFDYEISTSATGTPVVGGGVIELFAGDGS